MDVISAAHEMSEAQLRIKITNACAEFRIEVRYIADERLSKSTGWPDLTLLGTRLMHRELKSQRGTPTSEQWRIGSMLQMAGQDWDVWKPAQWIGGTVIAELMTIARVDITVFTAADIERLIK